MYYSGSDFNPCHGGSVMGGSTVLISASKFLRGLFEGRHNFFCRTLFLLA